jgi:hypothetical protein
VRGTLGLVLVAALVAACSVSPDTTRIELRAYLARAKSWAPVEAETNRTLQRIFATQFVDEAEVRRQIADSRPRILTHLDHVRGFSAHSKDVARVHARYLGAWERLLGGYDAIEQGFSSGDFKKLAQGREAMEAWREEIQGVAAELRELMAHFGVDADGATESRGPAGELQLSTQSTRSRARPAAIA